MITNTFLLSKEIKELRSNSVNHYRKSWKYFFATRKKDSGEIIHILQKISI